MVAKPSCRTCYKMPYKWYKTNFVKKCPHCGSNQLLNNPKRVYEKEVTCGKCGADYCGVCGHEKVYNLKRHKKYYLKK